MVSEHFSVNECNGPFIFNRNTTVNTICRNLVHAGVLLPEEIHRYKQTLLTYEPVKLLKVLITSHELREYSQE